MNDPSFRPRIAAAAIVVIAIAAALTADWPGRWPLYGVVAFGVFMSRSMLAVTNPTPPPAGFDATVVGVVPAYNEDRSALQACVDSLIGERCALVVVVDDGSSDVVELQAHPDVMIVHQPNGGKREAMRAAVERALTVPHRGRTITPDYYVTVDSDTVLAPGSLPKLLGYFDSPDVGAVTGLTRPSNWDVNALTRAQDLRYSAAFMLERSAHSRLGSVLCVCGSYTAWRADLLAELVEPLTTQTFLGQSCTFGDDRHLTNLALQRGWKVRLGQTAVAETLVPERWGHWFRQQERWAKSFIRESIWAVRHLHGVAFWLSAGELLTWITLTSMLTFVVVSAVLGALHAQLVGLLIWVTLASWVRTVRWFEVRPNARWRDRAAIMLVGPAYGVIHLAIVVPLRLWALGRQSRTNWGTRSTVEVAATEPIGATA